MRALLLSEEFLADARALLRRDLDPLPSLPLAPFMPEPTATAERRRETDETAARDGEHGTAGIVQIVRHPRRFVDDQQINARVTADGAFCARQGDHAGAIGQGER